MIRTRDFLVFSAALVFLLTAITATALTNSLSGAGQVASVSFAVPSTISGAEVPAKEDTRGSNVARLKSKIAAGEGNIQAGEPVFTSVDTVTSDNGVVTDQSVPDSVTIGHTMDGQMLSNGDLWRFVGYSQFEQIGMALNGTPIFGSRSDSYPLDQCHGADEGVGYRLYIDLAEPINPACFGA